MDVWIVIIMMDGEVTAIVFKKKTKNYNPESFWFNWKPVPNDIHDGGVLEQFLWLIHVLKGRRNKFEDFRWRPV